MALQCIWKHTHKTVGNINSECNCRAEDACSEWTPIQFNKNTDEAHVHHLLESYILWTANTINIPTAIGPTASVTGKQQGCWQGSQPHKLVEKNDCWGPFLSSSFRCPFLDHWSHLPHFVHTVPDLFHCYGLTFSCFLFFFWFLSLFFSVLSFPSPCFPYHWSVSLFCPHFSLLLLPFHLLISHPPVLISCLDHLDHSSLIQQVIPTVTSSPALQLSHCCTQESTWPIVQSDQGHTSLTTRVLDTRGLGIMNNLFKDTTYLRIQVSDRMRGRGL